MALELLSHQSEGPPFALTLSARLNTFASPPLIRAFFSNPLLSDPRHGPSPHGFLFPPRSGFACLHAPLSATAFFLLNVLLLLCDSSAAASWIWSQEDGPSDAWLCFRADVMLGAVPEKVPAKIAADSTYWLWINGQRVITAGGLKRGPTPNDTYCDSVDLAPFLKSGSNSLAALVWFWGADGSSHISSGKGGFLLDSTLPALCTGSQWRFCRHPAFRHGEQRKPQGVRSEYPVIFDARADLPGWTEPGYDDARWEAAVNKGVPPAKPWGELVRRPIPFFRYSEPRKYENASALNTLQSGSVEAVAYLPANLQVYPRFKVVARAGCKITVQPEHSYEATDYITRDGEQSFEVPAWGNGHFVTYRIPDGVKVLSLDYRETGYDADFAGEFRCEDSALEKLWLKCARSVYVNLRDNFMDCPDRERSQWPGDMANSLPAGAFLLDRRADAIGAKALREFLNWQAPNGVLWGAVPSGRFRGSYREFPAQSLALIAVGFPFYVNHTGDRVLAAEAVPRIRRYLLDCWPMNGDGLPEPRPTKPGWNAGTCEWMDWGKQIDRCLLETAWYAWALAGFDSIRHAAELPPDPVVAARRSAIASAFDRVFWDDSVHAYRSNGFKEPPDDRGNAIAVCAGLAPSQRNAELARLFATRDGASIYMEHYVLDALFILGSPEAAMARLKRRYADCIASPCTTLPEDFGQTGLQTNHAWGAAVATTLVQHLAGVRPTEPGCGAVAVEPCPAGLNQFELRFPSIRGAIDVSWACSGATASLKVTLPKTSTGTVVVPPVRKWTAISCNGIAVWPNPAPGCPVTLLDSSPRFKVREGSWNFEAK